MPLQSLTLCFFLSLTFRALSVILYLIFLFIVVVILLNVLIAQVSDTYSKVLSTVEGVYLYHRCQYTANVHKQLDRIFHCLWSDSTEDADLLCAIARPILQITCGLAFFGITSLDLMIAYGLALFCERQVS